jgi:predicted enzyme related to lactoylglutathione lyase
MLGDHRRPLNGRKQEVSDAKGTTMTERLPAVVHWDINARDAERLSSFYGELFGWDLKSAGFGHPYRYLDPDPEAGGIGGGIGEVSDGSGEKRHMGVTFYVRVDDLSTALDRAQRLGAERMWGPTQVHEGLALAMFRDPEGNAIGLMSDVVEPGERGSVEANV